MALGASREDILKLVLRHGSRLAIGGIAIGLFASLAATRALSSMLFDVTSKDPETFVGVAILLAGVAVAASYIPARRAAKVDPMTALRCE
jgi:putative ABC transport system permease protein